jgi:hypothetical protein
MGTLSPLSTPFTSLLFAICIKVPGSVLPHPATQNIKSAMAFLSVRQFLNKTAFPK